MDSPYRDDGTIDWAYFNRPATPGQVYIANEDTGEYDRDTISLDEARLSGYGSLSDYEKREIYNDPADFQIFSPNQPSGTTQPFFSSGIVPTEQPDVPVIDFHDPGDTNTGIYTQSHADVTNDPDPKELVTAGFSWSDFYDKFLAGMPPFSLFPGGSLFEFGQGLFDNDQSKPDSSYESLGQNVGNTIDLFSNPLMLMVLIMGMGNGRGNSMSSLLPLLLIMPMLTNNIQGGPLQ